MSRKYVEVVVEVSVTEGRRWSTDANTFRAFNLTQLPLSHTMPGGGPAAGGTLVTVHGDLLIPNHAILPDALPPPWEKNPVKHYQRGVGCDGRGEVACLFTNTSGASARATASIVDWNHARCRTPPMAAGLRSVRLTYDDGYSRTPAAAYAFAVYDDDANATTTANESAANASATLALRLNWLHPTGGPERGTTIVTLHGGGFADYGGVGADGIAIEGIFCRFSPPGAEATGLRGQCGRKGSGRGREPGDV